MCICLSPNTSVSYTNHLTFDVGDQPIIFDKEFTKIITDVEKDQLKDIIKPLYENMSRSETRAFIIITLDEIMEHCLFHARRIASL